MKNMKLLGALIGLIVSSHAQAATQYRVDSAESVVDVNGDKRCITFLDSNVFGEVGQTLNVEFTDSELSITENTDFPEGITLEKGHHVSGGSPAGGAIVTTDGEFSPGYSATFLVTDRDGAKQTIYAMKSGNQLTFSVQDFGGPLATCTMTIAN